jgi:NADH-quinone oxidoreductase subunit K
MVLIPIEYGLFLSSILFILGVIGVLVHKDFIFILLSLEIMFNAVGLAFVIAGARWQAPDGQIMYFLILTLAAAELSVALGLAFQVYHRFNTLNINVLDRMRG